MASQVVPAAKRYRISQLVDAYGELLTDKQRTFIRHYYEEDLSFGEIAREYSVSRQAIFDSVKHGEDALEHFERTLALVASGWMRWAEGGLTPARVAERLAAVRERLGARSDTAELDALIDALGHDPDASAANDAA